jgi:hypothetical protein
MDKKDIEIKSLINDCSGSDPVCGSWEMDQSLPFIPHDAYYEIADLSVFEPPFTLLLD